MVQAVVNSVSGPQLAARAGRGDLRATEALFRQIVQSLGTLSPAELAYIDGVVPGAASPSKALVVDANGQIDKVKSLVTAFTIGTTGTVMSNNGISTIGTSAGAAAKTHLLAAPEPGLRKTIIQTGASTSLQKIKTQNSSVVKFVGNKTTLTMNGQADTVILIGLSSTLYGIESNVGAVLSS